MSHHVEIVAVSAGIFIAVGCFVAGAIAQCREVATMTFNILDHLDKLIPADGKDRYICPVCEGNNLTINPKDGKYQCWSGCDCRAIRDAIAPLVNVKKAVRPKSDRTWTYTDRDGNESIRTRRADDGQGKRKIWQEYFIDGQWFSGGKVDDSIKTPLKKAIAPYKYVECQQAIARGEAIYWTEGEPCADALWQLGLAATTSIGGSASYDKYGNYSDCFGNAQLVIVPDRDKTGIKYSEAIASDYPAAQWLYPFPDSPLWDRLPKDGGLDVADWIEELRAEGLGDEEIRDRIVGAVGDRRSPQQRDNANPTIDEFEGGKPHYWSKAGEGLYWESYEQSEDGQTKRTRTRVGNHLQAIAYVNSPDGDGASLLLEFKNQQGQLCKWTMPRRALGADGGTLVGELLARGYGLVYDQKRKLARYLTELGTDVTQTYTVTDKTGWVDNSFVLPNCTYGDETLRFRDVEPSKECPIEVKGTLDGWRSEVAAKCEGNSRLTFALGTAFAAPLLPIVDIESGGFHLVGGTSQGKTTALNVAASVVGIKEVPHWRTTTNGLEGTAMAYNHMLLPLDEIGQAEPKEVGAIAYMLANGQGKSRMKRDLSRSPVKNWQLLFLSSGELGLKEYLKQAGNSIKGGQEVRLPDLPAIPKNSKYGVFESIAGFETPVEFVRSLETATQNNRGTALDAFLQRLVVDNQADGFAKQLTNRLFAIAGELAVGYSDAAISRVAKRFALVQVALEIAHSYGLLPFAIAQCGWAVQTMFTDWVNARGGDGSIEIKQALERIEHLFVANEHSDRVYHVDGSNDQTVRNLLAYRKKDNLDSNSEYWVPPAIFNRELAIGVDREALITELQAIGWLKEPDAEGKNSLRRYLNGKRQRFYVFTQFWSDEKSGVPSVPGVPATPNPELELVSGRTPQDTVRDTAKNEVSHDCTEFDTTRDTLKNEVSRENVPGVPKETTTGQGLQGDGTHRTPGTPQKGIGQEINGEAIKDADDF